MKSPHKQKLHSTLFLLISMTTVSAWIARDEHAGAVVTLPCLTCGAVQLAANSAVAPSSDDPSHAIDPASARELLEPSLLLHSFHNGILTIVTTSFLLNILYHWVRRKLAGTRGHESIAGARKLAEHACKYMIALGAAVMVFAWCWLRFSPCGGLCEAYAIATFVAARWLLTYGHLIHESRGLLRRMRIVLQLFRRKRGAGRS